MNKRFVDLIFGFTIGFSIVGLFFATIVGTLMYFAKPVDNDCRWLKRQIETTKGKITPGDFEVIYKISMAAAEDASKINDSATRDLFFCTYVRGRTEEIFAKYK